MSNPELDHKEAWNIANYKREYSNSARCYIELHHLLREVQESPHALDYDLHNRIAAAIDPVLKAP